MRSPETGRPRSISCCLYSFSSTLMICTGAHSFASLLMMWRSGHKIVTSHAEKRLQQGLDAVTTGSKKWKMLLSAKMSECSLTSTHSHETKCQTNLTLDGQPFRYNDSPKVLGMTYDRQLTVSRHADHVLSA